MNKLQLIAKIGQNREEMEELFGKVEVDTIIKKIKGERLRQTERNYLSRSIRPKLRSIKTISELGLIKPVSFRKKEDYGIIIFNLSNYGYELIAPYKIKKQPILELEELIVKILIQFPEPRFIEAIPIIIIKNKIDPYNLFYFAKQYDLINEIGYLLDISFMIAKKLKIKIDYLKDLLHKLEQGRQKDQKILGIGATDEEYLSFLKKTSPETIKKWNLLGRYFDKDFIELGSLYLK